VPQTVRHTAGQTPAFVLVVTMQNDAGYQTVEFKDLLPWSGHCRNLLFSGERPQRARQLWRWMYHEEGGWVNDAEDTVGLQNGLSQSFRCSAWAYRHRPSFEEATKHESCAVSASRHSMAQVLRRAFRQRRASFAC